MCLVDNTQAYREVAHLLTLADVAMVASGPGRCFLYSFRKEWLSFLSGIECRGAIVSPRRRLLPVWVLRVTSVQATYVFRLFGSWMDL